MRNPLTDKRELSLINPEQEIAIGLQAAPEFEKEFGGKIPNEQLQQYLREIGGKLAAVSDRQEVPYEFALLGSKVPNGFALPGGKIYITAGLMEQMSNERQLAAVLAHETVHVAGKHSVNALQRQMGTQILIDLASAGAGESAQTAETIGKLVSNMANMKYSRNNESESDAYGVRYMVRAGYNPWGMVELLEVLQSISQSSPGLFGELFSSHPSTSERIKDARNLIRRDHRNFSANTADPQAGRFIQMRKLLEAELETNPD